MSNTGTITQREHSKTENGMMTNVSSLDKCVDMFFTVGAMRGQDVNRLLTIFHSAFNEDPKTAMKVLFWARDVRGGAGERQVFRDILLDLVSSHPETVKRNLNLIPEYGRWDDVMTLVGSSLEGDMINLVTEHLVGGSSLVAKWVPRKGEVFNKIRKNLNVTPKTLRKMLVELSNTVEQKMCSKQWNDIEYSKIPSLAMSRYGKAFGRNDGERFGSFIEELKEGNTKVNAGAVYPYDIIKSLHQDGSGLANEQWKALPDYMGDNSEIILPVVDVSGSMIHSAGNNKNLTCMDVSVSLGIYISERNEGPFKDMFLTFSSKPQLQKLSGTLKQRVEQLRRADWGYGTNLTSTFKLILEQAVKYQIPQDQMPTKVLVLSDMEFDEATQEGGDNPKAIEMIDKLYEESGYVRPGIVFWNIQSRGDNYPCRSDENGTALISGFSPSIMKSILGGEELTPFSVMMKTIGSERYEPILG